VIYSRQEFIDKIKEYTSQPVDLSILFIPEKATSSTPCHYFICIPQVRTILNGGTFWAWNDNALQGTVLCFSSDHAGNREWWGFTVEKDITWFMARWCGQ